MKISLTRGAVAIIDAEDHALIAPHQWRWHPQEGYALTTVREGGKARTVYMHRLINGTPMGKLTDHIDRDPLNNRRANLRTVDHSTNALNTVLRRRNASGYRGVYRTGRRGDRWRATLIYRGRIEHLGVYLDPAEASRVYERRLAQVLNDD